MAIAEDAISSARGKPQGLLRINATLAFRRDYVAPAIAAFPALHPTVQIQLALSDAPLSLSGSSLMGGVKAEAPSP